MKKQIFSLLLGLVGVLIPQVCLSLPSLPEDMIVSMVEARPAYIGSPGMAYDLTFIHVRDNIVVGRAEVRELSEGRFYLDLLKIEPKYQSRSYGQRLFKLVCMYVKQQGGKRLEWMACPFTAYDRYEALPRLIKFYEKLGGNVISNEGTRARMYLILKKTRGQRQRTRTNA